MKMDSTMDTGKARANTVSTEEIQTAIEELSRIPNHPNQTFTTPPHFYTGPFVPSPSFVIPSNHTADDLLKRAISQR
jgi:hypothetical protein